ncbi:MAG: hypothetical protein RR710_04060 [Oscillospiraceae bacterium]
MVRTDNMSGTKDGSLLKSVRYFVGDKVAEIDNGMVVKFGALLPNEREIRKATVPTASTPLNEVVLVASPEYMVDERKRNLTDFTNEAGDAALGYMFHTGSTFGCTVGCFDVAPKVGDTIELMAGTTFKAVATATASSTTVGKCIAIEGDSGITYYVVEVA